MRKAHEDVATQFGLGVSQAALVVGERIGYELRSLVPVYVRVFARGYWMRSNGVKPCLSWPAAGPGYCQAVDSNCRLLHEPRFC